MIKHNRFKFLIFLLAFLLVCCHLNFSRKNDIYANASYGETPQDAFGETKEKIKEFLAKKSGGQTFDEWIADALPKDVGNCAEWYVISLYDKDYEAFLNYEKALSEYVSNKNIPSHTTREKFALTFASLNTNKEYIEKTLNESLGKQGIMSYVYGLHLINNGYSHDTLSTETVMENIMSNQLSDGGWALQGDVSDVDVTAMTVQALAPYYNKKSNVTDSINTAVDFLSKAQMPDGDFVTYGVTNPESTAQVIIALSALKIDFKTNEKFIKNGKNLLDGVLKYQLADGSFSHTFGGKYNPNSTVQVFFASLAYEKFIKENESIYIFNHESEDSNDNELDDYVSDVFDTSVYDDSSSEDSLYTEEENSDAYNDDNNKTKFSVKTILVVILIVITIISAVALIVFKKTNYKNFIALIVIFALLLWLVLSLDIKSKNEYYTSNISPKENIIGNVTMSISCEKLIGRDENIPSDGIILSETEFSLSHGETVYDILIEASRKYSILVENDGNDSSAYIVGINNIFAGSFGDLSGWMFFVNGEESSVGSSSFELKDGDKIEWFYSLEFGKDFK